VSDPEASARITVRQLLNQTSGIPNSAGLTSLTGKGGITREQRVREMNSIKLANPPGTKFEYSSVNYVVLGLLIETVSGQSYEEYIRQNIFGPLDMRNSLVSQSEAMKHGMATGYRRWYGFPFPADMPYLSDDLPAGFIISNAEDMSHFLIANIDEGLYANSSILSPERVAELHRPAVAWGKQYYGMGWIIGTTNGVPTLSNEGMTANFLTTMIIEPDTRWGIIVLANASNMLGAGTTNRVAAAVLSQLAGNPPSGYFWNIRTTYIIIDIVILVLTALLVRSIVLIPRWRRQLIEDRPTSKRTLTLRVILPIALAIAWPLIILLLVANGLGFSLQVMMVMQPDLSYWVIAIALLSVVTGLVQAVLAYTVLQHTANVTLL
jgi:hypothetical protein